MPIINAALSNRWARKEVPVSAGSSEAIDTIPLSQYKTTKYFIEIGSISAHKSVEMLGARSGAGVEDSVYAKIGDILDVGLSLDVVGPDVVLSATNNELFDVIVTLTKTI